MCLRALLDVAGAELAGWQLGLSSQRAEVEGPLEVTIAHGFQPTGSCEELEPVEADGLEQAVPARGRIERNQRLLDECPKRTGRIGERRHHTHAVGGERSREHREFSEQVALVWAEEVVAPVDHRRQRLMAPAALAAATVEHRESLREPLRELGQRE